MYIRLKRLIRVFLLLSPSLAALSAPTTQGTVGFANGYRLEAEIADTQALREYGLMHREQLDENRGMLFVYPDQDLRGVWMKNTLLALDILFLSADHKIVSMLRNLTPCRQKSCPVYTSVVTAQYMLEVNAGFIDRHQIETGQEVMLDYRHGNPPKSP